MTQKDREQFDEHLTAYLDGELDEATRAEVETYLARTPEARERLESLRQVALLVSGLPRARAPDDTSEATFARLERRQLFGGVEVAPAVSATPPGVLSFGRLVGAAAVILVAVLAGYLAIDAVRQPAQVPIRLADADDAKPDEADVAGERSAAPVKERREAEASDELSKRDVASPVPKRGAPRVERDAKALRLGDVRGKDIPVAKGRAAAEFGRLLNGKAERAPMRPKALTGKPPADRSIAAARRKRAVAEVKLAPARETAEPAPERPDRARARAGRAYDEEARKGPEAPDQTPMARAGQVLELKRVPTSQEDLARPPSPEERTPPTRMAARLRAGMTVGELETYPLADEPVRLVLSAPDPDERTRLAWGMRAFFARNAIQDARLLGTSARLDGGSNFYLARPGGAEPRGAETFLLRATTTQVASLVDELSRTARQDVKVTLATPAILAEGWRRANMAAEMLRIAGAVDSQAPVTGLPRTAARKAAPVVAEKPATTTPRQIAAGLPAPKSARVAKRSDADARRRGWRRGPSDRAVRGRAATRTPSAEPVGPPVDEIQGASDTLAGAESIKVDASKAGTSSPAPAQRIAGRQEAAPAASRPAKPPSSPAGRRLLRDALAPALAKKQRTKPAAAQLARRIPTDQPRLVTVVITVETAVAPRAQATTREHPAP